MDIPWYVHICIPIMQQFYIIPNVLSFMFYCFNRIFHQLFNKKSLPLFYWDSISPFLLGQSIEY